MSSSRRWGLCWVALIAMACVQPVRVGSLQGEGANQEPDAQVLDGEAAGACQQVICRGRARACGDCDDNDADGVPDADDPDCWGPCDDDEQWLGDEHSCPMLDCYFDPNCGSGNDQRCIELTPNGCDCFGCCEVPALGFAVSLGIAPAGAAGDGGPACNSSSLDDPELCRPCQQDATCVNPCEDCELCFGKPQLEPECALDGACAVPHCNTEQRPCGDCAGACDVGQQCITGCCVAVP